jgi:uncharacterized RDD family membrane protein YckC
MDEAPKTDEREKSTDWGRRMGAALVDVVAAGALFAVSAIAASLLFVIGGAAPITLGVLLIVGGGAAAIMLGPLLMCRAGANNGQTLGKQSVDLRVVRDDGQPVGLGLGVLREVVFKLLFGVVITGGLFLIVDALWPLFERNGLAVHDLATQSRVVDARDHLPPPVS